MNTKVQTTCAAMLTGGICGFLFLEYSHLLRIAAGGIILYIVLCIYRSGREQVPALFRAAAAGFIGAGSEKIMQFLLFAWTGNADFIVPVHYLYWIAGGCVAALLSGLMRRGAAEDKS